MGFSKEWVEKNNLDIEWDFVILDEIQKLELYHCGPLRCEGFKTQTICKNENDVFLCYIDGIGYIEYTNLNNI